MLICLFVTLEGLTTVQLATGSSAASHECQAIPDDTLPPILFSPETAGAPQGTRSPWNFTQTPTDAPPALVVNVTSVSDSRTFTPIANEPQASGSSLTRGSSSPYTGTSSDGLLPPSIGLSVRSLDSWQSVAKFQPLIDILDSALHSGHTIMLRSKVSLELSTKSPNAYREAGVTKFKEYTTLAKQYGIVELGGSGGLAWISLHPSWHGRGQLL